MSDHRLQIANPVSQPGPRSASEHEVGTKVVGGFSGSAVINLKTGAVIGTLTTSNHEGSAHMLPVAQILHTGGHGHQ
ncbi:MULTISPECIES: hypothetical protein [unclassified Streptomyces]|uniref:hypothetical protein n=1 Tax=unclassified Streptomyces TaxID=2593676 RepID=UPI00131A6063|nr:MULTISPECIES: hypothetical protein [unclassified Streptomyces]